jgi:hypothetical protein
LVPAVKQPKIPAEQIEGAEFVPQVQPEAAGLASVRPAAPGVCPEFADSRRLATADFAEVDASPAARPDCQIVGHVGEGDLRKFGNRSVGRNLVSFETLFNYRPNLKCS